MRLILRSKQKDKLDNRIQLAKTGAVIALTASILMTLIAPIALKYRLYCVLAYIGFYYVNTIGFSFVKRDIAALLLYAILSAFVWGSYVLMFALILLNPEFLPRLDSTTDTQQFAGKAILSFLTLSPALALFFVGLWFGPVTKTNLKNAHVRLPAKINHNFLLILACGIILLKFVGQTFFDVGSPIKVGQGLPALILALYEFIVQDATIVILNIIFFTLLYLRIKRGMFVIGIALVLNVGLSLSAGWKGEMVFQGLALVYFFFEIKHRVPSRTRRRIFMLTTASVCLILLVYPFVNEYRWAIKEGLSPQEAITKAQRNKQHRSIEEGSGLPKLLERVDSIGTYISAVETGKNRNFSLTSLWSNAFSQMIKYELYGTRADDVMVAFSTTQFAALYLVGGWVGLYFGAFCLGLFFRNATSFTANHIVKYATTFHGYLPFLCFAWISVLLSGGNMGFKLKELFVVIVSIILVERLLFRKVSFNKLNRNRPTKAAMARGRPQYRNHTKRWPPEMR